MFKITYPALLLLLARHEDPSTSNTVKEKGP
jgi:hypothetical protein